MTGSPQLKTLKISKLFGYKDIELNFQDVTVLVGRNGVGKTTILKILNAMLTNDFECNELKLCRAASVTFSNNATVDFELARKYGTIARDAIIDFIENQMSHELKLDFKRMNDPIRDKWIDIIVNKVQKSNINYNSLLYQDIANDDVLSNDPKRKSSVFKLSKAMEDYLHNKCEIRYISTMNLSANAIHDITMSSGKEKNILTWELNQELQSLAKDKNSVYTKRFIKLASDLLSESGKRLHFRKYKGVSHFDTVDITRGNYIKIDHLSSGERQLLYILSRVGNTRDKPSFLLMDEPEISLHLNWQEKLISSIKYLNKNCQIIIVTHSPAIVMDGYMDSYIDMGDITKESDDVRL